MIMESHCPRLSVEEIDFIRKDVKKCGISFSHLEEELIDHLCCLAEEYMQQGYSFNEAYRKVKLFAAFDSLQDIEIQTLLYINKKILAMKTTLKITGIAGLTSILIASVFKVLHWPGAGVLLTLGVITLAFAYIPVLFFSLKKEKLMKRKRNLTIVGIITAFLFLISILFAMQHWPYRVYIIILTWLFMLTFLIMLFNNIIKSEENRILHLSMILFFTILLILDIAIYMVNLNNPKVSYFTLEDNLEESIRLFEHRADAIYAALDTATALETITDRIVDEIKINRERLFNSEEDKIAYTKKLFKNRRVVYELESEAMQLGKDIKQYRDVLLEMASASPDIEAFIKKSIRFNAYDFNNAPPILYNNLNRLIRDIRIAEVELLNVKKKAS